MAKTKKKRKGNQRVTSCEHGKIPGEPVSALGTVINGSKVREILGAVESFLMPEKIYVCVEPLYDIKGLAENDRKEDIYLGISEEICSYLPCENFWKELFDFENKSAYRYQGGTKQHRFAMQCTIMLPKKFPPECRKELVKKFMEGFCLDNAQLPYQAFEYIKGNGNYIRIFYSERLYSEKGFEIPVYSRGDFYRDPKTGRRCKATKKGAVLVSKNGEKIGFKKENFSLKVKGAGTGNGEEFNKWIEFLKENLLNLFNRLFEEIKQGIHFKKINREKYAKLNRKPYFLYNIARINRMITYIETTMNALLQILQKAYLWDDLKCQEDFYRIVQRWKGRLNGEKVRYNNRVVFYIKMNEKWGKLDGNLATIVEMFDKDVMSFYETYVCNPNELKKLGFEVA